MGASIQLPGTTPVSVIVLPSATAHIWYDRDGYVIGIEVK